MLRICEKLKEGPAQTSKTKKGDIRMSKVQITQAGNSVEMISAGRYLDDVALAETLLHNANQNGGKLSNADIVFGLRNLLKMKYYP